MGLSFKFQSGKTHGLIASVCCLGGSSLAKLANHSPRRRRVAGMRQINFTVFVLKAHSLRIPVLSNGSCSVQKQTQINAVLNSLRWESFEDC